MAVLIWGLLCWLAASVSGQEAVSVSSQVSVNLVYRYKVPTWIENLVVRPNGWILLAEATTAALIQLNPANGEQQVLHDWSAQGSSIMSITDVRPDVFLANTMYCDMTILECTAGTGITWLVDLRHPGPPCIRELASGPNPASLLNGVAALNERIVFMVDQNLGGIWGVDTFAGGAKMLFTDETMMDPTGKGGGVNGIRVVGDTLYFNNPSRGTFGRVTVDPVTGCKVGNVTIVTSGLGPDDFEIDPQQRFAYISNGLKNQLLKIDLSTGLYTVIVEGLTGPTTARWISQEERGKVLYVGTSGGVEAWLSGNVTQGGSVYRVTV